MNTADILSLHDRCPRAAHWGKSWQFNRLHPNEILRMAVDAGVMSTEDDPGQFAGDCVMTLCAERGLDVEGVNVFDIGLHTAALADLVVTVVRAGMPAWARPEDRTMKTFTWVSGAFREPSGVRLRRIVIVDRWTKERELAESHSWRSLGEMCAYELPMTMSVVIIGQRRNGKHYSPWSKGWLHPRSRNLRIRKRSGEGFGGDWKECWRETADISRDKWLDQMHEDGIMSDVLFDVELDVPCPEMLSKIGRLAEKKLTAIQESVEIPPPNISVCDWPTPCQFRECCWTFQEPSERLGFIPTR